MPERELFFGRPSGSAMPLVWAHAEYVKLCRSIVDNRVFDMPSQTRERYLVQKIKSRLEIWRFNHKTQSMKYGKTLRVEVLSPALVHWSADGWGKMKDVPTQATGLGIHYADLPTNKLPAGSEFNFTFYWSNADEWEGSDFHIRIDK